MKSATPISKNIVSGLIDVLKEKGQTKELEGVARELEKKIHPNKHIDEIIVVSTVPLSADQKKVLTSFVKKSLGLELPLVNTVDRSIIGGFKLTVGSWFVDASLGRDLDMLRRSMGQE